MPSLRSHSLTPIQKPRNTGSAAHIPTRSWPGLVSSAFVWLSGRIQQALSAWYQQMLHAQEQRALRALSPSIRRDLGLTDTALGPSARDARDW